MFARKLSNRFIEQCKK
ncbi:unnamed protein product, partial [Onchocerca ochengi]|uniref:Uncharacterized protein n=1 Tax=Onchocerca ochengi TaxID=42157 RepID=A0A182ERE0_ONCOC